MHDNYRKRSIYRVSVWHDENGFHAFTCDFNFEIKKFKRVAKSTIKRFEKLINNEYCNTKLSALEFDNLVSSFGIIIERC